MPKAVRDNPEEYAELVVAQALKVAELRDGEPCVLVDHVHEQLGGGPKSTVTLPTLKRLRDRGVVEQYEDEQHRSWVRRIGDLPIVERTTGTTR